MMKMRRTVLALTGAVVAVLTGLLSILRWDDASQIASAVSAVAAVASLGVAVCATLPRSRDRAQPEERIRLARTGAVRVGTGGTASTGLIGSAAAIRGAEVEDTGEVEAGDGCDVNTGVREG